MAEQIPEATGEYLEDKKGLVVEEEEDTMRTVELNSGEQRPVLEFQQQGDEGNSSNSPSPTLPTFKNSKQIDASAATNVNNTASSNRNPQDLLEGTHLQGRTGKTLAATTANLKVWSFQQYKVTKQALSERLGKGVKTVDAVLESRLEGIRDTQRKYQQLMSLSSQLQIHMQKVVDTQRALAEHFAFLSVRCPDLSTEFELNSETQKRISRNGDTLISSLGFFISNIYTVSAKSIEDTLVTAKNYETTRLLYDAYRTDLDNITKAANTSQAAAARLPTVQAEFEKQKEQYEKIRRDLDVKLKLLDENRYKVMQRQLVLLHSAFGAYFSGNHSVMESLLKEFHEKLESLRRQRNEPPTWLEDLPADRTEN